MVKSVRESVKSTFFSVNLRVIYQTCPAFHPIKKDHLPDHSKSNLVYQFTCKHCESVYIGKCYRRLKDRITEHVPLSIRRRESESSQNAPNVPKSSTSDAVISNYRLRSSTRTQRRRESESSPKAPNVPDSSTIEEVISDIRSKSNKAIVQPAEHFITSKSTSSIKMHLLENKACAESNDSSSFKILATGRNKFHLDVLEGVYINSFKPVLCRHKEFVYHVKLFKQ